jgi:hypothetical protein
MTANCKICCAVAEPYADIIILGRHNAKLFACCQCGFVFIDPVYWLDEAYSSAVTSLDVGYVGRNFAAAEFLADLLQERTTASDLFVDFGGGYGMLVRLMRDKGFRFHLYEPFAPNLFAHYCIADKTRFGRYRALTAIEVFEHLADPVASVQEMAEWASCIIFTTELCLQARPTPEKWWYIIPEEGQHISFFTRQSLEILAARCGMRYHHLGGAWHAVAVAADPIPKRRSSRRIWLAAGQQVRRMIAHAERLLGESKRNPALHSDDFTKAKEIVAIGSSQGGGARYDHLDADLCRIGTRGNFQ